MTAENRPKKSLFVRGIATALNSCGNAVIVSYDAGAKVVGSLVGLVKRIPGLPIKMDFFSRESSGVRSKESESLYRKIKAYEGEIKAVYYEIGKASAQLDGDISEAEALRESEAVTKMLAQVKDYEKNIAALKERIVSLEEAQKAEEIQAKEQDKDRYRRATLMAGRARKGKERVHRNQVITDVNMCIKEALIHGNFESASDRTIFDKVATDLLDKDIEIRMLAAAELGKMGNKAAVPVLHAAIVQGEGPLVTEIINSLIALGDPQSVPVLFDCSQSANGRVRVCALRGLYKLAPEDEKIRPIFHEGLGDQHPEVRKTAATMLGWLDDANAVPALVQCLTDDDVRVRKAVIAALANIRDKACIGSLIRQLRDEDLEIRQRVLDAIKVISGEQVEFNVSSGGETLDADIERLKKWWQEIRTGKESEESAPVQEVCEPAVEMPGISGIDAAVAQAEAEMAEAERLVAEKAGTVSAGRENTADSEIEATEYTAGETPEADILALEPEEIVPAIEDDITTVQMPADAMSAIKSGDAVTATEEKIEFHTPADAISALESGEAVTAAGEQTVSEADEIPQADEENTADIDAEGNTNDSSKFKRKGRNQKYQR